MDRQTDSESRARFLRRLKWGAIVLPALFALWSETVRHQFFDNAPVLLGNVITAALAFAGAFVVAQVVFHNVERIDAALVAQNHRLTTLHALAAIANEAGDEATLLAMSLPVIRAAFGARDAQFAAASPAPPATDTTTRRQTLRYHDEALGVLILQGVPPVFDQALFSAIGDALAIGIANRRLTAQAARLAVLEERDRIARELHDGLAQTLAAITWQSERARAALADGNPGAARVAMDRIEEASSTAYEDVREAIVGLRIGDAPDFLTALRQTVDRFGDVTGIAATVEGASAIPPMKPMTELHLLRIVQESLTNVRKHARATTVRVRVIADATGDLQLSVTDDGIGFDPDHMARGDRQHFGLIIMRERIESLGGLLGVEAAPGRGTTICVRMPAEATERRGVA